MVEVLNVLSFLSTWCWVLGNIGNLTLNTAHLGKGHDTQKRRKRALKGLFCALKLIDPLRYVRRSYIAKGFYYSQTFPQSHSSNDMWRDSRIFRLIANSMHSP